MSTTGDILQSDHGSSQRRTGNRLLFVRGDMVAVRAPFWIEYEIDADGDYRALAFDGHFEAISPSLPEALLILQEFFEAEFCELAQLDEALLTGDARRLRDRMAAHLSLRQHNAA